MAHMEDGKEIPLQVLSHLAGQIAVHQMANGVVIGLESMEAEPHMMGLQTVGLQTVVFQTTPGIPITIVPGLAGPVGKPLVHTVANRMIHTRMEGPTTPMTVINNTIPHLITPRKKCVTTINILMAIYSF